MVYSAGHITAAGGDTADLSPHILWSILVSVAGDTTRTRSSAVSLLRTLDEYLDRCLFEAYFDCYGSYLGHVVAVRLDDQAEAAVQIDPKYLRLPRLWRPGPPNWLISLAAKNGSTAAILHDFRCRSDLAADIRYVRPTKFGSRYGHFSRLEPAPSARADSVWDEGLVNCVTELPKRIAFSKSAMALARPMVSAEPPFSVGELVSFVYTTLLLGQYTVSSKPDGDPDAVLLWAWMCRDQIADFANPAQFAREPSAWNAGNVPCLVGAFGTAESAYELTRDWLANLPTEVGPPIRLERDLLGGRFVAFEP